MSGEKEAGRMPVRERLDPFRTRGICETGMGSFDRRKNEFLRSLRTFVFYLSESIKWCDV